MEQERPGIVFLLIVLVLFSASVGILHKRKKIKGYTDTMFALKQHPLGQELFKQASKHPKSFFPEQPGLDVVLNKGAKVDR
jgi:hypothetical protein